MSFERKGKINPFFSNVVEAEANPRYGTHGFSQNKNNNKR